MKGEDKPSFNLRAVGLFTFTGSLGGLSVGYNCAIVAGACLYLDSAFPEPTTVADKSVSAQRK